MDTAPARGTATLGWPGYPEEPPVKGKQDITTVAQAMWRGKHLVGISSDLSWLPADLVAAADYRLVLPVMSGADLDTLACELSGGSVTGVTMPDDIAAGMTPRVLRLARRPGQNPDDYIGKVRDILARDQTLQAVAKATTATPRTAPSLDLLPGMAEATAWGRDPRARSRGIPPRGVAVVRDRQGPAALRAAGHRQDVVCAWACWKLRCPARDWFIGSMAGCERRSFGRPAEGYARHIR